MNSLSVFASYLSKQTFILKRIASLPWKSIFVFLFIVFLPIASDSQIQLSSLSSQRIDLSQRTFGIPLLSPSILFLIPLIFLLALQYKKTKQYGSHRFEIFFIIFFISTQISIILGMNIQASFVWMLKLIYGFTIYLVFSRLNFDKKQLRIIILAFLTTIFSEGILAGLQFIKGNFLFIPFIESVNKFYSTYPLYIYQNPLTRAFFFRAPGTFSDPNHLSHYLALLAPIITVLLFSKTLFKKSTLYLAMAVCFSSAIISFSRWGMITMIFAFSLTGFLAKKFLSVKLPTFLSLGRIKIGVLIVLISLLLIIVSNPNIEGRFLLISPDDSSLTGRLNLITQAIYTIKENLFFGVGGGNFVTYFANYDFTSKTTSGLFLAPVHSFYLLLASENGLVGFCLFFLAMFMLVKFFLTKINKIGYENKIMALGLFASIATFFFDGLWTMRTFEDRISFLFFLTLGLFVNMLSRKSYQ